MDPLMAYYMLLADSVRPDRDAMGPSRPRRHDLARRGSNGSGRRRRRRAPGA